MTKETLVICDFADIQAIRLECRACKTSLSLSLDSENQIHIPEECPQCHEKWISDRANYNAAWGIVEKLREARSLTPDRFAVRLVLGADTAG